MNLCVIGRFKKIRQHTRFDTYAVKCRMAARLSSITAAATNSVAVMGLKCYICNVKYDFIARNYISLFIRVPFVMQVEMMNFATHNRSSVTE